MTKAEERALEVYPVREDFYRKDGIFRSEPLDLNLEKRGFYQQGYKQAEKDLSLTIEDIELLHTFLYAVKNNKQGVFTFTRLSDEQYEEILRRFKKAKEEQK